MVFLILLFGLPAHHRNSADAEKSLRDFPNRYYTMITRASQEMRQDMLQILFNFVWKLWRFCGILSVGFYPDPFHAVLR